MKIGNSSYGYLCALAMVLGVGAQAADITIYDLRTGNNWGTPGSANPGALEDQENEVGSTLGQDWDLEAFTYDASNKSLGIISGFDLKTGTATGGTYPTGDIWVRIGSQVDAGDAVDPFGGQAWDYVIDITKWGVGNDAVEYSVYNKADVAVIPTSNPNALITGLLWQADPKAGASAIYSGKADYQDNVSSVVGYNGDNHDILTGIDLSWLTGKDAYFFVTPKCGNDLLHGHTYVPDGGLTLAMLGMGLAGLGVVRRYRA